MLLEDLRTLQARAEKFEDLCVSAVANPEAAKIAEHYRQEATKVRNEILKLNRAAADELGKPR